MELANASGSRRTFSARLGGTIKNMRDTVFTLLAIFVLLVLLPMFILWTRDRIRCLIRRETPQKRDARLEAWRERMLHPKPEEVEALCSGLLPQRLLDMYNDFNLLFRHDFEVCAPAKNPQKESWWIGSFVPLDSEGQKLTTDLSEFGKGCCFAGDGMGNFYWVPVDSERTSDAPVFFACHDPWGNERVADSLQEFLSWPHVEKNPGR